MELADVQAAIADYEKRQKHLINARKHRLRMAERYAEEAKIIEQQLDSVQDSILALIKTERELKGEA